MNINNMPVYANEYTYIVVIECNKEYWFYGAYNNKKQAEEIANICEGKIFNNLEI